MKNLTIDQLKENGTQYASSDNGVRLFAIGSYYKWVWVAKTADKCKVVARQARLYPCFSNAVNMKFTTYTESI